MIKGTREEKIQKIVGKHNVPYYLCNKTIYITGPILVKALVDIKASLKYFECDIDDVVVENPGAYLMEDF